jgi:tyrosyl-tRNA synthetase
MAKIITDEKLVDEVLDRGVEQIFPGRDEFKKVLMSGKRIRLYCGYDPTAKALHIGNAISINKLGQFQRLGHDVIFLIGDFTGMIGDPTDKTSARKKLTREQLLANSENYKKQASGYLKFEGENPARVMFNSQWSDPLTFKDLIEITSNFTVQQMIARDMFQERIKSEKPIYLHEFLYPVAQGYDSVGMDVDLEIGGNDQMFNMLRGRDLMKVYKNKEKFVMTLKLLSDDQGKKMGKTEGNVVNLDETPEDMFGRIMSWPDGVIAPGFELCTNLPMEKVKEIEKKLKDDKNNPRDLKMQLAYEIVKINHGEEKAEKAKENFVHVFSEKETPEEVMSVEASMEASVVSLIVESGLAESNADAKRKIEQGGVEIDGKKITNIQTKTEKSMDGKVLKVGKRGFRKIEIK